LKAFTALLAAIVCLLAIPATAPAAEFTVDSTADESDAGGLNGVCLSVGLKCTLRAAIEESNSSAGTKDTIKFSGSTFEGLTGDTIAIGSSLTITASVKIDGKFNGAQCNTSAGVKGPCVEVSGPASGSSLVVENANDVEIEGLAITAATGAGAAAINVINSSAEFEARADWIGAKLDGSAGANNKGIFLDPDSNGATIGGKETADRNVFANNFFEGLDIEGADDADVLGNYFGVKPDGATQAANGKNIEITDTVAFEATGNEVGTTVSSGVAPCDGGCNVISGAGFAGIDLQGNGGNEAPATGPTTIHGNYIGLNVAGTATVANAGYGIDVNEATDTLIGGPENEDANFIAGSAEGIFATDAEGLEMTGNIIGAGAAGAEITAPGVGVLLLNGGNVNPVAVADNVFDMDGGVAVDARFGGTDIIGNFIEGAELGVWTKAGPGAAGETLIEDNVIGESLANGIRIEDSANLVLGNAIYKSGSAGIRIQNPTGFELVNATENVIGGEVPTDENNINESGTDAIEINNSGGEGPSQNEVALNRGAKNGGFFIDLIGTQTNGGILPPAFATAAQSSANGAGAQPGATIRVFRKKEALAGELESPLGKATADGSGDWKVTYAGQVPVGTIVAASQTSKAGGTSELSITASVADPTGGGGSGGSSGKDDKGKPGKDKGGQGKDDSGAGTVPETSIIKGPKGKIHSTTAKFKFSSNEKGAKFECRLDRKKFKPCKSPKTYKKLKPGKHVFKVRALKGKQVDPTPAKRKFKVLK
jgi:CSLREA domain-containing protein